MADKNDLEVAEALGRIEGKLDTALERQSDQEVRIRSLEKKSAWMAGAAAVGGTVAGFIGSLFGRAH